MKSVCEVWNLCARFEIWLPGLKSFAGFWGLLFEGIANESQCLQTYTYFFRVFYAFTFPFNTRDWENRNQNAAAVVQPKRRENTTAVQLKGRENVTAVQSKIKENAPADQLKGREEVKFVVNFNLFEKRSVVQYTSNRIYVEFGCFSYKLPKNLQIIQFQQRNISLSTTTLQLSFIASCLHILISYTLYVHDFVFATLNGGLPGQWK